MKSVNNLQDIQILLFTLPCTNNKEYRHIISEYNKEISEEHLLEIFHRLFTMTKYSNTDMFNFLFVFSRFTNIIDTEKTKDLHKSIISLKFFPSDKDTDLVIIKYFEVTNKLCLSFDHDSLTDVFNRYVFLLSNSIVSKSILFQIYDKFIEFCEYYPLFLKYTIERSIYKDFLLKNEFIIDNYKQFDSMNIIDVFFESNMTIKTFIINNTKDKYIVQQTFNDLPAWYISNFHKNIIPFLFYNFDSFGIYKELGYLYYTNLTFDRILTMLKFDLTGISENEPKEDEKLENQVDNLSLKHSSYKINFSEMNTVQESHSCFERSDDIILVDENMSCLIMSFNKTGDLDELVKFFGERNTFLLLRYSELTDLKVLGEFLCKRKNIKSLELFTSTFDFHDLTVIEALRLYLSSFFLVGESQIIHRVLEFFSDKYFLDNAGKATIMEVTNDEKTKKFLFNLTFSLLVLNTKVYNPNIKTKPSFDVYMSDFQEEEIPSSFTKSYLFSLYESIMKKKMDLPTKNAPSKHNYKVYSAICEAYKIPLLCFSNQHICKVCILKAYKSLFKRNYDSFFHVSPDKFYELCCILDERKFIEKYLLAVKGDTIRFLTMFKYYLSIEGELELYKLFITVLKRIEKPKSSVLVDLRNSLLKGLNNLSDQKEHILPQYKKAFLELLKVDIKNINLLGEALKSTGNVFVTSLVVNIFENNIEKLTDVSMLDDENIANILDKCVSVGDREKFCTLSVSMNPNKLIRYYKDMLENTPRFLNDSVFEAFKKIEVYNETSFHVVIHLQKMYDMFDSIISISSEAIECRAVNCEIENDNYLVHMKSNGIEEEEGENKLSSKDKYIVEGLKVELSKENKDILLFKIPLNKDVLNCYNFEEKYSNVLDKPVNLFHFYASSKSVLNQSKVKTIHKVSCPLKQDIFRSEEMDKRLIYMIKKADSLDNKDILNYTLWVVNLVSSSLPLFCKFFINNFGLLLTLRNINIVNSVIKIFCSRLLKTINGDLLCCRCNYNSLSDVEMFIKMLIKYDLASVHDFDFYLSKRFEMFNEGLIRIVDKDLIICNKEESK